MNFRKTVEKLSESVLLISSMVTTVTVLFIIYFLFKSGVGLFNDKTVDKNHSLVVSINNQVDKLSSKQLKDIFNGDVINWSEVGGNNAEIVLISIDEIYNNYTEEQLGSNLENMAVCVNDYFSKNDNAIGYFENKYLSKDFPGKIVKTSKITLKEFFTGKEWYPTAVPSAQFGVLPLIMGTLWVTFLAILFALPIGLITAIYMAEIASEKVRKILKPVIELLAGIPSVVYGFFGLVVLVPFIQQLFGLPVGETALAGSIILGIMALPTIITVSEDAIRSTPVTLKEASLALGASHWQSIKRVVIPAASSGILASFILGIGRAIGETMAVLMVTGNAAIMPKSFLEPVRTIPATIAAELGEAPFGGTHFKALFALGIILFVITFIFNSMVEMIKRRKI